MQPTGFVRPSIESRWRVALGEIAGANADVVAIDGTFSISPSSDIALVAPLRAQVRDGSPDVPAAAVRMRAFLGEDASRRALSFGPGPKASTPAAPSHVVDVSPDEPVGEGALQVQLPPLACSPSATIFSKPAC